MAKHRNAIYTYECWLNNVKLIQVVNMQNSKTEIEISRRNIRIRCNTLYEWIYWNSLEFIESIRCTIRFYRNASQFLKKYSFCLSIATLSGVHGIAPSEYQSTINHKLMMTYIWICVNQNLISIQNALKYGQNTMEYSWIQFFNENINCQQIWLTLVKCTLMCRKG